MGALDLVTDCAICGAMGKGDWCGDDREEPDTLSWLCPCDAAYSHKNITATMARLFGSERAQKGGE